jgi:hypothetical protein
MHASISKTGGLLKQFSDSCAPFRCVLGGFRLRKSSRIIPLSASINWKNALNALDWLNHNCMKQVRGRMEMSGEG